jgi:hypothetical protein
VRTYLESHEQTVADCLQKRGSNLLNQTYNLDDGSADPLKVYSFEHPEQFGFVASDFSAASPAATTVQRPRSAP